MNVNSYYDDRHYQQLLHDENDYMIPWFQNSSLPHTPALSHTSPSPHDCYASNELLFSSISPQAPFADMYEVGSILIPSDNIIPAVTTSTTSTTSNSSSSSGGTFSSTDTTSSPTNILISPPTPPTITMNDDDEALYSPIPFKKVAHNAIERRYRNNINDRIRELQQVVPALCRDEDRERQSTHHRSDDDDSEEELEEEEDGIPVAKKLNKATILQKATEYIHYLKYSQQLLRQENDMLQHIIQSLPGGEPLLTQFLIDKQRFDQAEKDRRLKERKIALQQQRINHQRMLKERAAQRAALMSPEERQRRRRRSSQQKKKSTPSGSPSRLLSVFMGMTFFAVPSTTPALVWKQHRPLLHSQRSWSDYW